MLFGDHEIDSTSVELMLDTIPKVDELENVPKGTTVLVRADIDVAIKDGIVEDMSRIEADLDTVKYCYQQGWKTIIFGHLGRDKKNSVAPVCQAMSDSLGLPIQMIEDWLDEENNKLFDGFVETVNSSPSGTIFMLQNTRKYSIEQLLWDVDKKMLPEAGAKTYAVCKDIQSRLATIEINEAIAASNFDFSSSVVPILMSKTAMGFYIAEEMKTHVRSVRNANFVVFSGLKIDKLEDLEGVITRGKLKLVIAAGSLAMALLKAQAQLVGEDFFIGLAETDSSNRAFIAPKWIERAKSIVRNCRKLGVELVLPVDFVLNNTEVSKIIAEGFVQMDIGPETRLLFAQRIREYIAASKTAQEDYVMFYNGVFGKFEDPRFEAGTKSFIPLLKEMTKAGIHTYVGGGEGRLALQKYGSLDDVTHAFTCGGTILKSLTTEHIPFMKALYIQNLFSKGDPKMNQKDDSLTFLITKFKSATDFQLLEELADKIGDSGDERAIEVLIYRLGDERVQADADVEDAVCSALVKLGVMNKLGNLLYSFSEESFQSKTVSELIKRYKQWIPKKYFAK